MSPREVLPDHPIDPARCDCGSVKAGMFTHYRWCTSLTPLEEEEDTKELYGFDWHISQDVWNQGWWDDYKYQTERYLESKGYDGH